MGLLSSQDWQGHWIAGSKAPSATSSDPLPLFRRKFSLEEKPVRKAMVYVCGLGHFELSLNGQKVGDHFIDPGWTNYRKTCLYVPFDVTQDLHSGSNVFGIMLGNGMFNVMGGRYTKFLGSFGEPKVILEMRIEYADGTTETISTNGTWKTAPSPIVFSCPYGGEDYDARLEQPGWDQPGFDDTDWEAARVLEGPGGVLRAQSSPPVKVVETVKPVSIARTAPGEYFINLGKEPFGSSGDKGERPGR